MAPELVPVSTALPVKSVTRSNSGLTWIRQRHITTFLKTLAVGPKVTHELLDELPETRTRDYVRGSSSNTAHSPGEMRRRSATDKALGRVHDPRTRDVIERYVRWRHLRRMNETEHVSHVTFLRSKQTVTVAIDFVT
jgi:hypothetical protein